MTDHFDPYYEWLGIPTKDQPPHHYRLLGIELFEENSNVIERAADRQMAHLRTFQAGKYSQESQRLLNQVSAARVCLLDREQKAIYDQSLRGRLSTRSEDDNSTQSTVEISVASDDKRSPRSSAPKPSWLPLAMLAVGGAVILILAGLIWSAMAPDDGMAKSPEEREAKSPEDREANTPVDKVNSQNAFPPNNSSSNPPRRVERSSPPNETREPSLPPAATTALAAQRNALSFTGRDYVEIQNSASITAEGQAFTAEMWVRVPEGDQHQVMMGTWTSRKLHPALTDRWGGWTLSLDNVAQEGAPVERRVTLMFKHADGASVQRGRVHNSLDWHHVAFSQANNAERYIFIDGKFTSKLGNTKIIPSLGNFIIGCGPGVFDNRVFIGQIHAFRLSAGARYLKSFEAPKSLEVDASTLSLLDFSTGSGNVLKDVSGNNRDGKTVGAAWIKTEIPGLPAPPATN